MNDEQVKIALTTKAITLCIKGGSQEAQHLAAYYPIPVLPAFIIIDNGRSVLDLRAGEGKAQFKAAILRVLSSRSSRTRSSNLSTTPNSETSPVQHSSHQTVPRASTSTANSSSTPSSLGPPETSNLAASLGPAASPAPSLQSTTADSDPDILSSEARNRAGYATMPILRSQNVEHEAATPSNLTQSVAPASPSPGSQPSQAVQNLLADRRRRLEIDKKEKDTAEKAERRSKAEARKEAITMAPDSAKAKQATYAVQQKKRQQEAKLERERILRQIEHDKAERKEKEARRKATAKAEVEGMDGAGGLVDQQLTSEASSTRSKECAVQIRLFDGSTIRSRIPSDQTLRGNVRRWVDNHKSDDVPYTFKHVLTPMPNRTLSISDEEETLQSLGLTPSATLVIVPVQGYTNAYNNGQGIVSKGASAGYNVVSAGAGIITGALGTFLGFGRATAPGGFPEARNDEADTAGMGLGTNIRTLRDQRADQDDHQLYNGNQVM